MQHRRRMQNFQALLQHTNRRQLAEAKQKPRQGPLTERLLTASER